MSIAAKVIVLRGRVRQRMRSRGVPAKRRGEGCGDEGKGTEGKGSSVHHLPDELFLGEPVFHGRLRVCLHCARDKGHVSMMSGEPKCEVRSRRRTEDAHEVLPFADLLEKRFVPFIEARLLLAVNFSRAPVHGVDDGLKTVQARHGKPLHHPPAERRRANVHQIWQGPPEDGEVVQ